jgi:hypothetical protein
MELLQEIMYSSTQTVVSVKRVSAPGGYLRHLIVSSVLFSVVATPCTNCVQWIYRGFYFKKGLSTNT